MLMMVKMIKGGHYVVTVLSPQIVSFSGRVKRYIPTTYESLSPWSLLFGKTFYNLDL